MEGPTTPFGRVEFDPMSVPAPRRTERGDRQSFDRNLENARRAQDERTDPARRSRSAPADRDRDTEAVHGEARAPEPRTDPRPERRDADAGAPPARTDAGAAAEQDPAAASPAGADPAGAVARPAVSETARPAGAGAGGSANGSGAQRAAAAGTGPATPALPAGAAAGAAGAAGAAATAAAGASLALGEGMPAGAPARAVDVTGLTPQPAQTERAGPGQATVGYRTIDPHTLRLGEAARDSIFRQIAMHLTPERSELRMLVDPPELGKLDLQLVVEHGNQMRLFVVAERPELAVLLDKHMAELKQALESQGLSIIGTEVRSANDRGAQDAHRGAWGRDGFGAGGKAADAGSDAALELDTARGAHRIGDGYITGEGLDFWA